MSPVADVPALEVRARRQDDVREAGFALEPDGLVDHEGHLALPVSADKAVGLGHGADERAAVAVVHLGMRVAGRRVGVLLELHLDGAAAEALAAPLELLVVHHLGDEEAIADLAFGAVLRVGDGAALGPHARGQILAGGRAGRVAGDAALGIAREVEGAVGRRAAGGRVDVAARLAQTLHGRQGRSWCGRTRPRRRSDRRRPSPPGLRRPAWSSSSPTPGPGPVSRARGWPSPRPPIPASWGHRRSRPARSASTRRSRGCGWPRSPCRRGPRSATRRRCPVPARRRCPCAGPSTCRRPDRQCG